MTTPRFLQIHTLHAYSAALLNRDDTGLAKRLPYGGKMRTRVSSQCLKRHWRWAEGAHDLHAIPGAEKAVRSRDIVSRSVIAPLREAFDGEVLDAIEGEFQKAVYGEKATSSRQPLLLGYPEVAYLRKQAEAIAREYPSDAKAAGEAAAAFAKEARANFKQIREQTALPGGLTAALFGRMVTSDPEANIDAAIHVAHAFTVHEEETESDYFSVVDDLRGEDEDAGAAHIGDAELTSGLFYGYVVVDVPGLVSNLTGAEASAWETAERDMAAQVVEHLVHLIATVSPGAKLGSTAPYAYAQAMLVEAGDRQPRSLAGAYRKACRPLVADALERMRDHLAALDGAYGNGEARCAMSLEPVELPETQIVALPELASWAGNAVLNGKAA
ncbi:type I-E CRISPR-associated protein Cas7/Cse4/CasC [Kaustia mangrovi]|uniref:Type I-E CRISPR-associated protein Cas7/Cse4/CasC n=1 Tax=Kaustia mangrovi TaxID=2593653 RepID=A0A7S8HDS9_9HYPH|nr:type I-E CRISPR-associated protein Cas7/Cse4/CasC [Kaustia mangrovi]QPC44970.1 type I-E CRISPR-associated protein Cas7/Cse4/CasC [Kaustia mangrovi]